MDKKIVEIKFYGINFNCNEVYKTKKGTPIVLLSDGFYSIIPFDEGDIDGEPYKKLDKNYLKVVEEFSN